MQGKQMHFWVCKLEPFVLCLLLILGRLVPYHFLPYYDYSIQWALIPVFYFAVYNPKCLSSWAVFLLGLMADLSVQSPFGTTTFSFVLLFFMANFFRRYLLELTFNTLWGMFACSIIFVEMGQYLLTAWMTSSPIALMPVWIECLILICVYPFLMRLSAHLDKKVREAAL